MQVGDGTGDIRGAREVEGFTVIDGFGALEFGAAGFDEITEPVHHRGALGERCIAPCREGAVGAGDGEVEVSRIGIWDLRISVAGGGFDSIEILAAKGGGEFAIDKVLDFLHGRKSL